MTKQYLHLILPLLFFSISTQAQSAFSRVHTILQNNCTVGCHSGPNPSAGLDLSGSASDVYNALINVTPVNPSAAAKGYKLIKPGYTYESFLLKKVNQGFNPDNDHEQPAEGTQMPPYGYTPLSPAEIEIINNWIMFGAPQSGSPFNAQLIYDYYNGLGLSPMPKPTPPAPGTGIQLHLGSIYLAPRQEIEYLIKREVNFEEDIEVTRLDAYFNAESHHYLLFKFDSEAGAASVNDGLRTVTLVNAGSTNSTLVAGWQDNLDIQLPNGTGYFWPSKTILDFNYHILNYSNDSIMRADLYTNVYFRPRQPETIQMFSELYIYKNALPFPISDYWIPADNQIKTFTEGWYKPASQDTLYMWMLSSHTHKYGIDYDIYERNPDGTKGEQLYEGFYDYLYTFNQGYYDWEHPAVRYFEPQRPIKESTGVIHEAKYRNFGSQGVTFGLTTDDEMMLMFLQYTRQDPRQNVSVGSNQTVRPSIEVFPNPFDQNLNVKLYLSKTDEVEISLFDLAGRKIGQLYSGLLHPGSHQHSLETASLSLAKGVYILQVQIGEQREMLKVVR